MKHTISTRWLAILSQGHSHFYCHFKVHMDILYIVKVKEYFGVYLMVIQPKSPPPPHPSNDVDC